MGACFGRFSCCTKNSDFPYRALPSSHRHRPTPRAAPFQPRAHLPRTRAASESCRGIRPTKSIQAPLRMALSPRLKRRAAFRTGNSSVAPVAPTRACGLISLRHTRQRQICHDANGYVTTRSDRRSVGSREPANSPPCRAERRNQLLRRAEKKTAHNRLILRRIKFLTMMSRV